MVNASEYPKPVQVSGPNGLEEIGMATSGSTIELAPVRPVPTADEIITVDGEMRLVIAVHQIDIQHENPDGTKEAAVGWKVVLLTRSLPTATAYRAKLKKEKFGEGTPHEE